MPTIYIRAFFGVFTLLKESIYGSVQRTGLCDVGEFEKRPPGTEAQLKIHDEDNIKKPN